MLSIELHPVAACSQRYPSNSRKAAASGRYLRFKARLYSTKCGFGSANGAMEDRQRPS